MTIRRACRALPVERSTYHYRSRRAGQADLIERIKEIAETRVRYGYRRIHVLLRREGWEVNPKRIYRLYQEIGPATAQQNAEAAGQGQAARRSPAGDANERDLGDGLRPRPAGDRSQAPGADHRRHLLALLAGAGPRFNFRGADVVEVLERVGRQPASRPHPGRSGHRVRSRDLDLWAYQRGVTLDFSRPGKPTDNAFIESFNGKFRAECLNAIGS